MELLHVEVPTPNFQAELQFLFGVAAPSQQPSTTSAGLLSTTFSASGALEVSPLMAATHGPSRGWPCTRGEGRAGAEHAAVPARQGPARAAPLPVPAAAECVDEASVPARVAVVGQVGTGDGGIVERVGRSLSPAAGEFARAIRETPRTPPA